MAAARDRVLAASRLIVRVSGVVQGVGFRPFVFRQATALGLKGRVVNSSAGVRIDIEGDGVSLDRFLAALRTAAPPSSLINGIETEPLPPAGYTDFQIGESVTEAGAWLPVSPDSCTCPDCLAELADPLDRRYRYPFINCTGCGPRFTIIEALPYDRPLTTMRVFTMCPECEAEYRDPGDRRFHAEPNACPACGPQLWLAGPGGERDAVSEDPVTDAAAALRSGAIVALKGLGGFQLACLAGDEDVVARLRERKRRPDKPFALMVRTAAEAALYCRVSPLERELLESPARPIVLLKRHQDGQGGIVPAVAPRLGRLGVMLPYTPMHFLLMEAVGEPLVMTSGNLAQEPICRTNEEAVSRLGGVADSFLLHDREILSTYDDSVVIAMGDATTVIRRARGYAPLPLKMPVSGEPVLAGGAELKNTFCLTSGDQAIVSQHMGDLQDADTLLFYEGSVALYEKMFGVTPAYFACDHHPDYLSTAYVLSREPEPVRIQHHRAHIVSCMAENGFKGDAVGVALDGTGFGDDGKIWGGEIFTGSAARGLTRAAHFEYMPLPGGEAAIREPWRTALGAVWRWAPDQFDFAAGLMAVAPDRCNILRKQLWAGLNSPQTSSCGRLIDAVAALVLGRTHVSYEAQAAIELQALAESADAGTDPEAAAGFLLDMDADPWVISPAPLIAYVLAALRRGDDAAGIARRFHLELAGAIVHISRQLATRHSLETVALSGGVFQNQLLTGLVSGGLTDSGLTVLTHHRLPPGDGGISYGQAVSAIYQTRK
ncbi:MAG: carbamoyltransferase HypF [Thermoleophilia bacterium]